MDPVAPHVRRRVKALAERFFGVSISRRPRTPPNKHADEALRRLREWSSRDVVFDVGANDGRTILRLQEPLSGPRIFAFEPVAAAYRTLVRRTAHLPNVRPLPVALGAVRSRRQIYVGEIDALSSFSPGWSPACAGTELVDVTTVDEVMDEHGIDCIHFLKIDTEGSELDVLRGADRALRASRVLLLQVEVGVGQIEKDFLALEQARCYLAARGYFLYGIYNQCRTRARPADRWAARPDAYRAEVLAYCDALFVRADLQRQGPTPHECAAAFDADAESPV